MKTSLRMRRSFFLLWVLLSLIGVRPAQSDDTNHVTPGIYPNTDLYWGKTTNGISGGVYATSDMMQWHHGIFSPIQIYVFVRRLDYPSQPTTINSPLYWGATNSFCGPIALQNASGKTIPSLKPSVSSPASYPDSLSMRQMNKDFRRELQKYKYILSFPLMPGSLNQGFLRDADRSYLLTTFYLNDYFNLDKAGSYSLTVWPKLYEQSSINKDIYQRIDIPPVTVPIDWKGQPEK